MFARTGRETNLLTDAPRLVHDGAMTLGQELGDLFRRDLRRLIQELEAMPEDGRMLWERLPNSGNSLGNLVLHLEGNLREYIGRVLGGLPYQRQRDAEFTGSGLTREQLIGRVRELESLIPVVLAGLGDEVLEAEYPEEVLGRRLSARQFAVHLHGHFNYHLGQLDYLRRMLTGGSALPLAGL